jgi:tetratricopeptide (TPR) repeat protein
MSTTGNAAPERYDVFMSYAHSDRNRVDMLVDSLESIGVRVFLDRQGIDTFKGISPAIETALRGSKVLVAYYSKAYPKRPACQQELMVAYTLAASLGETSDRILCLNPEGDDHHISQHWLRDSKTPASGDNVAAQIAATAKRHLTCLGDAPAPKRGRWHGVLRGRGSQRFVGRLGEMWRIHAHLHGSATSITAPSAEQKCIVQVIGLGGTGKSLLAEEYARRFHQFYPGGVFWLSAGAYDANGSPTTSARTEALRRAQLLGLATDLGAEVDETETEHSIVSKLAARLADLEDFLWIVDDLPENLTRAEVERWLPPSVDGKALITTRSRKHAAAFPHIDLGTLPEDVAYALLTTGRAPSDDTERAAAHALVADLGGHALAIDVAGLLVASQSALSGFADFRRALEEPSEDVLELARELSADLPNSHEKSIAATLLRSLRLLKGPATDFMRLAAVVASAPISARLIQNVFRKLEGLDDTASKRHSLRAVEEATGHSLAEPLDSADGAWIVHVLVTRTVRFHESRQMRGKTSVLAGLFGAASRLSKVRAATASALRDILAPEQARLAQVADLAHAQVVADSAVEQDEQELLGLVAHWYGRRGSPRTARELYERLWHACSKKLGDRDVTTLRLMVNVGATLLDEGRVGESIVLLRDALEQSVRSLGQDHPGTLKAMGNLLGALMQAKELKLARELGERLLTTRERVLGPDHEDTVITMNNLGLVCYLLGDSTRGDELVGKALASTARRYGENHPFTLRTAANWANRLADQGSMAAARSLQERILGQRRSQLGEDHPDTLKSKAALAQILVAQGELIEGREAMRSLLVEGRRNNAGHPDLLHYEHLLGKLLAASGEWKAARDSLERSYRGRHRVLGQTHLDTLEAGADLAVALVNGGDNANALSILEEVMEALSRPETLASAPRRSVELAARGAAALEKIDRGLAVTRVRSMLTAISAATDTASPEFLEATTLLGELVAGDKDDREGIDVLRRAAALGQEKFGDSHPVYVRALTRLGSALRRRGQLREAHEVLSRARQAAEAHLGDGHPDKLFAFLRLAEVLDGLGNWQEALKLRNVVVDYRRTLLGQEHPDTLAALSALGGSLQVAGRTNEAMSIFTGLVEICTRSRGPDATMTLVSRGNLAACVYDRWKREEDPELLETAESIYREVLAGKLRALGPDDPETWITMNNLAGVLKDKGGSHLGEARDLFVKVNDRTADRFGVDHPDTLRTRNNLGNILKNMGEHRAARLIFEPLLAVRLRDYGLRHPSTSVVAINLFQALEGMGDVSGARRVLFEYLAWIASAPTKDLNKNQQVMQPDIDQLIRDYESS